MNGKLSKVGERLQRADSWHQVGAGGSDVVEQLSTAHEHAMLSGTGGNIWGQDPALLLEAAECGAFDEIWGEE